MRLRNLAALSLFVVTGALHAEQVFRVGMDTRSPPWSFVPGLDSPYEHWRVSRDKTVRTVGEPLNRLGYHVGLRREDAALIAKLKTALNELTVSGERERVRKKWETPQ